LRASSDKAQQHFLTSRSIVSTKGVWGFSKSGLLGADSGAGSGAGAGAGGSATSGSAVTLTNSFSSVIISRLLSFFGILYIIYIQNIIDHTFFSQNKI